MSSVNAIYHIVFSTKNRELSIPDAYCEDLYRVIWSIIKEKKCFLYRINGIGNHIHLLINLNPSLALSDLVRDLKSRTSGWMQKDLRFRDFSGWGKEYFAASVSYSNRNDVIEYIKSQKEHHLNYSFDKELEDIYGLEDMRVFLNELK